jgi:hypothetical protein
MMTKKEFSLMEEFIEHASPADTDPEIYGMVKAAYRELKERRGDEKWLLNHPELLAVHTYGDDGFALDCGDGTSAEVAHSTLHAAVTAAKDPAR